MPLPPPTSSTRIGVPAPTTGSSAAHTAAVRAGNCSAGGEAGGVGTCGSLVAAPAHGPPAGRGRLAVTGPQPSTLSAARLTSATSIRRI